MKTLEERYRSQPKSMEQIVCDLTNVTMQEFDTAKKNYECLEQEIGDLIERLNVIETNKTRMQKLFKYQSDEELSIRKVLSEKYGKVDWVERQLLLTLEKFSNAVECQNEYFYRKSISEKQSRH